MSETPKRMGRPRAYDPDTAIEQAMRVFWEAGYASSSLDDLGAAMSMSRPSLYGAFGDKEALYLRTLQRYRDESLMELSAALDPARPLREGLALLYSKTLDSYLDGAGAARGCFLVGTATAEAVQNPRVRQILSDSLRAFDGVIEDRLRIAIDRGEIAADVDAAALARLATSILHSLAVRARAGDLREMLEAIARSVVDVVCGLRLAQTEPAEGRPQKK